MCIKEGEYSYIIRKEDRQDTQQRLLLVFNSFFRSFKHYFYNIRLEDYR